MSIFCCLTKDGTADKVIMLLGTEEGAAERGRTSKGDGEGIAARASTGFPSMATTNLVANRTFLHVELASLFNATIVVSCSLTCFSE